MSGFNVLYDAPDGVRVYQRKDSDKATAERSLEAFKLRYLKPDGTGRDYPNGKGSYPFTNPRVVLRRQQCHGA